MPTASQFRGPVVGAQTVVNLQFYDASTDAIMVGSPVASVNCQGAIELTLPAEMTKQVPCGLDSGAYTVPAMTQLGSFGLEGLDFKNYDNLRQFNGNRCVATLITSVQGVVIFTEYIYDWNCVIKINIPKGDGEQTISCQNHTFRYYLATNANSASQYYYFGSADGINETT